MTNRFILLVEDNPNDELLTVRALKKSHIGNELMVVRDGAEALDFLFGTGLYASRDPNNKPELILLDLRLPKVDGIEVLRRLYRDNRTTSLPVIVFTSSNADRDMVDSLHYRAHAYMRKPVDFAQFIDAVRELGLHLVILSSSVSS